MKAKPILIITVILSLLACDNEDSVKSLNYEDSAYGLVGRWFTESNVDDPLFNMYAEYVFTADGAIYADEYRKINGYRRHSVQGKYIIKDNNITTEFSINQGGQSTSSLKVTNGLTFSAPLHRFSEDYTLYFNRIVGEITLTVDSIVDIEADVRKNIEAYAAQLAEIKGYEMSDEAIASVDESGHVTGKLIGVTFLKVETSVGTAVLKVSVSDNNELWNDYSKVLGKGFDEVEHLLGKHYAFKNDSLFRYYCDNNYIDSIDIYRHENFNGHENIVDSIVVAFRERTEKETITSFLKRKHLVVVDSVNVWYTNNDNFLLATFSTRYDQMKRKLIYTQFDPNWDDRIEDYGLSLDELIEKYGIYRSKNKTNTQITFEVKNDFVSEITYYWQTKMPDYHITVNMNITNQMIDNYLNKKFIYTYRNGQWQYLKNSQIGNKEMFILVSRNGIRSLYYYFFQNK